MRPLEPKDIYRIRTVGAAELSPDGKYIACVVQRIDEKEDQALTDLYLAEAATGAFRRLTSSGKDNSPRFSPDGRRLAFCSGRSGKEQLWILDMDGGEAWHLPAHEAVTSYVWGPDGTKIYYSAKVFSRPADWVPYPGAPDYDRERLETLAADNDKKDQGSKTENAVKVITSFRYRIDGTGYVGDVKTHIFECPVPVQSPKTELMPQSRQITFGVWNCGSFSVSPQGKYLAVSSRHSDDPDLDDKQDLWLYTIDSGHSRLLLDSAGPAGNLHWSPCGGYLAFTGHDRRFGRNTSIHLWLLDMNKALTGTEAKPLTYADAIPVTMPLDRPVGACAAAELRLAGPTMFWKDREFYFLLTDRGIPGIYKTDLAGKVTRILADAKRAVTSVHGAGDVMIYTASSPNQLEELYINSGGLERSVSNVNADFLTDVKMGGWEYLPYKSSDGQDIDGWVIYPCDYIPGRKYPLLVLIHGGPHGAYGPAFMFIGQQFSGRGYMVLFTNPRGSESYGQAFSSSVDGHYGTRDYPDIMAGIGALIARGAVDENNMFIHGWSYGGYMACWIATQTSRFKAICAGACVSNLLSDYGTSDITMSDEWEYGGQPWKDAAHLLEHSPLQHVESVETPLLLVHGENDLRCPVSQSEELYIALKRLGREVYMIRYPNEFHSLRRPIHRVDRYQRLLSWFDYHRSRV